MAENNIIGWRMPAEWEQQQFILMAYPHSRTDWAPILEQAKSCFDKIIEAITKYMPMVLIVPAGEENEIEACRNPRVATVAWEMNDTWARDFGPITLVDSTCMHKRLNFKFNGWGLKFPADKDNLATTRLIEAGIFHEDNTENRLNFVLEGGSIESNGNGVLMTTSQCLLSPNRNGGYTQEQIDAYLREALCAREIIWLEHGKISGDDTDSHIDTLARFVSADHILYVAPPANPNDPDYAELAAMEQELKATGYKLTPLPYAGPVYDPEDGSRLPATYANFLITPKAVLIPTYGLPTDREAVDTILSLFPDRAVEEIDCSALIRQHGSLHCVTMQL